MGARNSTVASPLRPPRPAAAAGLAVLTSRTLLHHVTSFMSGYPHAVHQFSQESDANQLLRDSRVGGLHRDGVLFHLAIAANDQKMLQLLFMLVKQPHHRRDPKLSLVKVLRCAVLYNRIEVLEHLDLLKVDGVLEWQFEPLLMRIAIRRENPDLRVLVWLYERLPAKHYPLLTRDMIYHTAKGNLHIVQWLHTRKVRVYPVAVGEAAVNRHTHVLRFFYEHTTRRCPRTVIEEIIENDDAELTKLMIANEREKVKRLLIEQAVREGQSKVVDFVVQNKVQFDARRVMENAVAGGNLKIMEYLHESGLGDCFPQAMSRAAGHGHLQVVKFLHQHYPDAYTPATMTRAARGGFLDIVKFFHENYPGSYPRNAMDQAAGGGHLEVVKYLHENGIGGCSTYAMDHAAWNGSLGVVQFLHYNRSEGCTELAMRAAAMSEENLEIVKFLCQHRRESDIKSAMKTAALHGNLEIVKYLRGKLDAGESVFFAVEEAARRWHPFNSASTPVIRFLCEHQENEPVSILKQAVTTGSVHIVRAVLESSNPSNIEKARAGAFALEYDLEEISDEIANYPAAYVSGLDF